MTEGSYRTLFSELVKRFGPHASWVCVAYPSTDKKEFNEFRTRMSARLGISESSFDLYVRWAVTEQRVETLCRKNSDYRVTWLRSKYHAYETGFIDKNYLDALMGSK